jgi:archaetidylinositol phosphate synthase
MKSPGGDQPEDLCIKKTGEAESPDSPRPFDAALPRQGDMPGTGLAKHQRVNDIFLGKAERKILHWLCTRMPGWITPDMLTLTAFLAGIIIAAGYAMTNYSKAYVWISSFGLVLNWFGDSLDGSLARHRKIERPRYGYFLDHSLDTLVEVMIAIGIGSSPFVRFDFVLFALIAYLMMSVSVNIQAFVSGVFQISYAKFGPTELRLLLIIANTVFYFIDNPVIGHLYGPIRIPDLIAIVIAAFLVLAFIVTTLKVALTLRRSDDSSRT